MATTSPKVTPSAPSPGAAKRAYGKVLVIRIRFHLHGARKLHLVLFVVGGTGPFQHFLEVWSLAGQPRFCAASISWCLVFNGDKILIAVDQAQAVDRRRVAKAVVVGELQLLAHFINLSQAHEIDRPAPNARTTVAD